MTTAKTKCACGKAKPYRRAYACKECWAKVSDDAKHKMVNSKGRTLRITAV